MIQGLVELDTDFERIDLLLTEMLPSAGNTQMTWTSQLVLGHVAKVRKRPGSDRSPPKLPQACGS